MPNSFAKQTVVAFEKELQRFEDQLVISKAFKQFRETGTTMERSNNTIWRPMPYIAQVFSGVDQTSNFNRNYTQLSVPVQITTSQAVPFTLSPTEARDPIQEERIIRSGLQGLASNINVSCSNVAALQGSVVNVRSTAASGFDDVAALDTRFNELGIPMQDRKAFYSSGSYNSMASNLQTASRSFGNAKSDNAYERALVGQVAGFDTFKLDYAYRLTAAAATVTITNSQPLYYTPSATTTSADGYSKTNNDNRYQLVSLTVASGSLKAGDCFTLPNVFEVHPITKAPTARLRTFRVISQATGTAGSTGNYYITPPIISGTGGTDPELQYKNVSAAPANGNSLTFLNTADAYVNPFWQDDAFEIIPGRYEPDPNAGMAVMQMTTESGIVIVLSKQADVKTLNTLYRLDAYYGVACLNTQMAGIQLFGQATSN